MREFHIPRGELLDLTIADMQTMLAKLGPLEPEPEWFVREWRAADPPGKLAALQRLLRD